MGFSPLFLMLPCCMAVNVSFMLPSSGSVPAMCYSYGHFAVKQMVSRERQRKVTLGFLTNSTNSLKNFCCCKKPEYFGCIVYLYR